MTDQKTISAYDSQVDNYVEIIKQQPVDNTLISLLALKQMIMCLI